MAAQVLAAVDPLFRALAQTVVPEAERLDDQGWRDLIALVEAALADRPEGMRRQLLMLIRLLGVLPFFRYGRTFLGLDSGRRRRFLESIQESPLLLLRRGFWGFRTLVLLGYYGRPEAAAEIGYRADPRGWEARR